MDSGSSESARQFWEELYQNRRVHKPHWSQMTTRKKEHQLYCKEMEVSADPKGHLIAQTLCVALQGESLADSPN